jgi:hypothetical protein
VAKLNVSLDPYPPQLMVITITFSLHPKTNRYPDVEDYRKLDAEIESNAKGRIPDILQ